MNRTAFTRAGIASAMFFSFIAQPVMAESGIISIKSKGMGGTSIAHDFGNMGVLVNPANAVTFLDEKYLSFYNSAFNVESDVIDADPLTDLGGTEWSAFGFNVSNSYSSSIYYGAGASLAVSDTYYEITPQNGGSPVAILASADVYHGAFGWESDDWNYSIGANVSGLGYELPDFVGAPSERDRVESYGGNLGFKSSRDYNYDAAQQSFVGHVAYALTYQSLAHVEAAFGFEPITLMPANYMAGAYFEFLHLNETISWQLGVSAEYEYVDEYGENNSMAAYEVKNRVRLGGELSILSLFDDKGYLSLRTGAQQHTLLNGETQLDISYGFGFNYGKTTLDAAFVQAEYPIKAEIAHVGVTFLF